MNLESNSINRSRPGVGRARRLSIMLLDYETTWAHAFIHHIENQLGAKVNAVIVSRIELVIPKLLDVRPSFVVVNTAWIEAFTDVETRLHSIFERLSSMGAVVVALERDFPASNASNAFNHITSNRFGLDTLLKNCIAESDEGCSTTKRYSLDSLSGVTMACEKLMAVD